MGKLMTAAQLKQQDNRDTAGRYSHGSTSTGITGTDAFPDPWAHTTEPEAPTSAPAPTPSLRETIAERTLAVRENNGYHDSYFSALVEHPDGGFGWVTTGSTAVGGGFIATVDATSDVRDRYQAWWLRRRAEIDQIQAAYEEPIPAVGKTVTIHGGRKHVGKTGTITWYGLDQFKSSRTWDVYRAQVTTPDGEQFFVPADYLSVHVSNGDITPARNTRYNHNSPLPQGTCPDAYAFAHYPHPGQLS